VDQLQLAERRRRLETAQQELSRREEALARREIELAEQTTVLDGRLEELAALISSVQEGKMEMLEANEEEIVSFSLSITEKVLQYEIENGRYRIGEVVRSTLRAVRDRGALVVRVNPRDHELTRAAVERLAQTYGTTRIRTVPDESIPLASCCIETDSGKIFSEIPGRLERIERSLLRKNGDSDGV
jgi:flagellar biosynthesis/type III secretory pathway protein FliH